MENKLLRMIFGILTVSWLMRYIAALNCTTTRHDYAYGLLVNGDLKTASECKRRVFYSDLIVQQPYIVELNSTRHVIVTNSRNVLFLGALEDFKECNMVRHLNVEDAWMISSLSPHFIACRWKLDINNEIGRVIYEPYKDISPSQFNLRKPLVLLLRMEEGAYKYFVDVVSGSFYYEPPSGSLKGLPSLRLYEIGKRMLNLLQHDSNSIF